MNPENNYSKGIGDDSECRLDKENDQNRYRCRIRHGKIKVFSKGDIVDLKVLKDSVLTDRSETMIRVKSNSERLKRVIDVGKYSFSQVPYLEREERITDQSNWKKTQHHKSLMNPGKNEQSRKWGKSAKG